MKQEELNEILEKHEKFLMGEPGGKRANLRDANLVDADLRDADLRGANLRDADLCYVNLRCADFRDADLRYAVFHGADFGHSKGVISFCGQTYLAVAFEAGGERYINIGCFSKPVKEWMQCYKKVGAENGHTKHEINLYGAFIKFIDDLPFICEEEK